MKHLLYVALLIVQFFACRNDLQAQVQPCGTVLSTYRNIPAKSNAGDGLKSCAGDLPSDKGTYGWQYQCVEYVKRFYAEALLANTSNWYGNAVAYYATATDKGLNEFPNDGSSKTPPAPDDILVFDSGDNFGHVAIVTNVTTNSIALIEQNWSSTGVAILSLANDNGSYSVGERFTSSGKKYHVLGWLRLPPKEIVLQPDPEAGKDIWTTSVYSYANCSGPRPGGGLYNEELRVGGWGDWYCSLLQFDLTGLPQHATSATLQLYCYSTNNGTPTPMYLDRITQPWWTWQTSGHGCYKERLWWVDKPPTVQYPGTLLAPVAGQWYPVDITALYNDWQSDPSQNYGLQLRPVFNSNTFNYFYSSRHIDATLRPKIEVVP